MSLPRLINNSGIMAVPERTLSEDGYELQFATNHLGPFIFTNTILPALRRSPAPRIVSISSWGHHLSDVFYDDPKAEKSYDKWKSYGGTKTANVLFAISLSKRGVPSVSLHPGMCRYSPSVHKLLWWLTCTERSLSCEVRWHQDRAAALLDKGGRSCHG